MKPFSHGWVYDVVAAYLLSTPPSSAFARLVRLRRRAFYFAIGLRTFYEIINFGTGKVFL